MALNLAAAGHDVRGFDLSADAMGAAEAKGLPLARDASDAGRGAEAVITMLPSGRAVLGAYIDPQGFMSQLPAGALLIDSSTIDVADAQQLRRIAREAGHSAVDAPVSGGVGGANGGTLTFMVGGDGEDLERAREVFAAMGKRVVHCGESGAGQAAKLCNNMILGATMIAVSEAFVLGEALGLSDQTLFDVTSNSTAQCWALTTNCPVPGPVPASPANRDFAGGFSAALMAKDLGIAATALRSAGVVAEIGLAAERTYAELASTSRGSQDFSTVINHVRARSAAASAEASR
jgi:3-hydroxyisobutyrate dehydrogenase